MAEKVLDDFAYNFITKGTKAVLEDMEKINQRMRKLQKEAEKYTDSTESDTDAIKENTLANERNTKSIEKRNFALWKYAKGLLGVYGIYKLFQKGISLATNFADTGNALYNMSTLTGASTAGIQKWGYAVRKFGGNEKSISSTLGALQSALYNFRYTGNEGQFKTFMEHGGNVPVGQDAEGFLLDLAKQMERWTPDKQRFMANALGLDPATTALLMQGFDAVKETLGRSEALYSSEDINAARQAKESLEEFNREMEKLGVVIGRTVLPYLTEAVKGLTELIRTDDKKTWFDNTLEKLGEWSYDVLDGIFNSKSLQDLGGDIYGKLWDMREKSLEAGRAARDYAKKQISEGWQGGKSMSKMLTNPVGYYLDEAIPPSAIAAIDAMEQGPMNSFLDKRSMYSYANNENNITLNGVDVNSANAVAQATHRAVSDAMDRSVFNEVAGFMSRRKA